MSSQAVQYIEHRCMHSLGFRKWHSLSLDLSAHPLLRNKITAVLGAPDGVGDGPFGDGRHPFSARLIRITSRPHHTTSWTGMLQRDCPLHRRLTEYKASDRASPPVVSIFFRLSSICLDHERNRLALPLGLASPLPSREPRRLMRVHPTSMVWPQQ